MGALMSLLWSLWRTDKRYKVIFVGLDNAGKTTALYKLQLGAAAAQREQRQRRAH